MSRQVLAIALCRVSSIEQLQNNSLKHQKDNVLKAAESLGTVIPEDGIWAGQQSSKQGLNYKRKDLVEMLEYCKGKPSVKYLIVQEVDRFMRSPDEQTYWIVKFYYEVGVKVWFADRPELNTGTLDASLFRYLDGYRAGSSNNERMNKSINGHTYALKEGRWTFVPKPGYMKGRDPGMPEIHPIKGPAIKKVLIEVATYQVTPSQALKELNNSEFMNDGHSHYKMDKFRKILTDPFYAGIVEMKQQVEYRNENGLHEPLISIEQHNELLKIMNNKPKNQSGPRKNGNPDFPCNNVVNCDFCIDKKNGRVVGYNQTNGKSPKIYPKYRCRACGRYISKQELHSEILRQFQEHIMTTECIDILLNSLSKVWKRQEGETSQEINRLTYKLKTIIDTINQQVEAVTDPSNAEIKQDIMDSIAKKKLEVVALEDKIDNLKSEANNDKTDFLKFALTFVCEMSERYFDLSDENRLKCKQIIFPGGFYLNADKKVYTPQISELFTLASTKKDAEASRNSLMVRVTRL